MALEGAAERERREAKLRRELGPGLVALMRDPEVREVMVNPDGRVFVDHARTGLDKTPITVEAIHMKAALSRRHDPTPHRGCRRHLGTLSAHHPPPLPPQSR